jgi:four helix bundle protein
MEYKGFRDLIVFQVSYKLALEIFKVTEFYPKEELYSLTGQIRRSSRSVPGNIAEAWRKRKYPKFFISKLTDALAEESETEVWLDFSKDLHYIDDLNYDNFIKKYDEVARMLSSMIDNPDKFCH